MSLKSDLPPARSGSPLHWSGEVYDDLGIALLVAALILVGLLFGDYGITHDEAVQNEYGRMILAYYTSFFQDSSALEYLDLFHYGGFFDLLAAILNLFSPLGVYETRHLLGGALGVVGLAGVWRLGRLLGGERAGVLALVLLALTPPFWGHMFNNPKDAPFASAMLWTLYYLCRFVHESPTPPRSARIGFGIALGIALGIRAGALLMLFYLGIGLGLRLLGLYIRMKNFGLIWRESLVMLRSILMPLGLAYAVMALLWPWSYQSPLNPLQALMGFSTLGIGIETKMGGQVYTANHLPAFYIPGYLAVTLPEIVLAGLGVALVMFLGWLKQRRHGLPFPPGTMNLFLTAMAGLFPVLLFVLMRPTAYNGLRHFLFVVPPLAVLAAVALDRLWEMLWRLHHWAGRGFTIVLMGLMVVQAWQMAMLHPHQYIFYNQLVGGVAGAEGKWEMDYWSNSLREATLALADYVDNEQRELGGEPKTWKVMVCGHALSSYYYFPPNLVFTKEQEEADFMVMYTVINCQSYFEGRTIAKIQRFGVPLALVRDRRYMAIRGVGR
ncbi:MAG: glycosyltransferase family 39 protein [Rhodospirillales bacterium]|nr:glycosyltransferase family 39 protein [Rhodospirillales bacterium]